MQDVKTRVAAIKNDQTARPKRYDNIDGTGEMFMGLMLLGFALLGWLQTILPTHSVWHTNAFLGLLFMYLVMGPILGLGFLGQKWVKRRFTWRRTGYVALGLPGMGGTSPATTEEARKMKRLLQWGRVMILVEFAVLAGVVGAGVAGLMAFEMKHPDALNLAVVGNVLYLGMWVGLYAFWIWCMGRGNGWKWGLLVIMAVGLAVIGGLGPVDHFVALARPVPVLVGSIWMLSGAITLVLYLRHNPPPAQEAE